MFNIICDYLIFFGFLIGSTLFPLWGSLMRKKKPTDQAETKANYVFATGQVGIFAMMLSIARGTLGVRAFLEYMVATLWLLSLLTVTLIRVSECVYAPLPLVKCRRLDNIPFGIQDVYIPEKRTKTSLSIIAPLDVLRQRLLLEIARRQMRENSLQAQKNREILKNIGKRSSGDERPIELERFEPYQQHQDLNELLNTIAEAAAQTNEQTYYNMQTPDYYFDESNAIDAKPLRFHSIRTSSPGRTNIAGPNTNSGESELAWHEVKQLGMQQQKQHPRMNGDKSLFRQLNQQINEKYNTDQQQQQQQKQQANNNADFIQSLELK